MFWAGFGAVVIVAAILALIAMALVTTIGTRYPVVRYLGYIAIVYVALLVLTSPFSIAAEYESTETLTSIHPDCYSHRYEVTGKSLAGNSVFSLETVTDWCSDGSKITRPPFFRTSVSTAPLFWQFAGTLDESFSGGNGEDSHWDYVQGKFSYCPLLTGCIQHVYPSIGKQQYADGTAASELDQ